MAIPSRGGSCHYDILGSDTGRPGSWAKSPGRRGTIIVNRNFMLIRERGGFSDARERIVTTRHLCEWKERSIFNQISIFITRHQQDAELRSTTQRGNQCTQCLSRLVPFSCRFARIRSLPCGSGAYNIEGGDYKKKMDRWLL